MIKGIAKVGDVNAARPLNLEVLGCLRIHMVNEDDSRPSNLRDADAIDLFSPLMISEIANLLGHGGRIEMTPGGGNGHLAHSEIEKRIAMDKARRDPCWKQWF